MGFLLWVEGILGRRLDEDGVYGAQCVDLVNAYLKDFWHRPFTSGNAIDIGRQVVGGFHWTQNTPTNWPRLGDIVVWGGPYAPSGLGPFGHTAICIAADVDRLLTLDQNWPAGSAVTPVLHNYGACHGWQALNRLLA